jgi:hypothetical protein
MPTMLGQLRDRQNWRPRPGRRNVAIATSVLSVVAISIMVMIMVVVIPEPDESSGAIADLRFDVAIRESVGFDHGRDLRGNQGVAVPGHHAGDGRNRVDGAGLAGARTGQVISLKLPGTMAPVQLPSALTV